MKTYHGYRRMMTSSTGVPTSALCVVTVCTGKKTRPLKLRLDIRNHSPSGFEWGYGGSGPAQLALALVADACGRSYAQPGIYQRVKERIVAKLPHDGWTIAAEDIEAMVLWIVEEMTRTAAEEGRD